MKQREICRTCKHITECLKEHPREVREKQWNGAWDEWTCGHWQQADEVQVRLEDLMG